MQADNKHNSVEDLFSRSIQQKLDGFRLPVEDIDWLAMQNRIRQEKRKQTLYRLMSAGGAVAAIGLLLFYITTIPSLLPEEELTLLKKYGETLVPPVIEEEAAADAWVSSNHAPSKKSTTVKTVTYFPIIEKAGSAESNDEDIFVVLDEDSVQTVEKKKTHTQKDSNKQADLLLEHEFSSGSFVAVAKKKRWQVSTGFAGSGGISNNGFGKEMDNSWDYTNPGTDGNESPTGEEQAILTKAGHRQIQHLLDQRDYKKTSHALPVTFSFTVRNRLSEKISLETGLVYTHLSSRMEQYGKECITTQIKQHYIGIPLNVVVDVWQQDQWNWYVSAGGMIEKGVRLAVNEEIMSGHKIEYVERRSGMNGVQTSLQISSGIEYALSQQWSLYVEPRFSYYFDNNQPISVRTERPLVVSLGGGLRYSF